MPPQRPPPLTRTDAAPTAVVQRASLAGEAKAIAQLAEPRRKALSTPNSGEAAPHLRTPPLSDRDKDPQPLCRRPAPWARSDRGQKRL